jgi:predicted nucleotidyltransferase
MEKIQQTKPKQGCADMKNPENNTLLEIIEQKISEYMSVSKDAKKTIKVVYLFGSVLNPKKFKDKSDIDLAFLVDRSFYKKDPFTASSPAYLAATEIGLLLNRQTDVIILNSASIETAYQAITSGSVIYEAHHDLRLEFEATLKGLYFDFKPFLDKLRQRGISGISDKKRTV